MAEFYFDASAIGNEYQDYADVPATWGMPQDGNGKAGPGHAAAVAVASISVAGCTASGTGTIGVFGVTVSSTLNASGAALATAIAAAINAASTPVSATFCAELLPLNRLVFARVNPVLSTQVQIMLRIAGTDWVSFSPTQANISPAATISNFAGGADGPFAYLMSDQILFGRTACSYGLWFGRSAGIADPGTSDMVHGRTARGGVNITASVTTNNKLMQWRSRNYLFDNGVIWPGENGAFKQFFSTNTGSEGYTFRLSTGCRVALDSAAPGKLVIECVAVNSFSGITFVGGFQDNASFSFRNSWFTEAAGRSVNAGPPSFFLGGGSSFHTVDATGALFRFRGATGLVFGIQGTSNSCTAFRGILNGAVVEIVSATATIGNMLTVGGDNPTGSGTVSWVGGAVYDTNGVFSCPTPVVAQAGSTFEVLIDGVAGITNPSMSMAPSAVGFERLWWNQPTGPNRGFRIERPNFSVDWKGDGTFPHCGAANLMGDLWSHRVTWNSVPSAWFAVTPIRMSHFYRSASAVKTITVELYMPNATTFYLDELQLTVTYIDNTNVPRSEVVGGIKARRFRNAPPTVDASTKVWTANGVASFSAKKIALTTSYPIAQNTEVTVALGLCASRSPTLVFYVSPEPVLS